VLKIRITDLFSDGSRRFFFSGQWEDSFRSRDGGGVGAWGHAAWVGVSRCMRLSWLGPCGGDGDDWAPATRGSSAREGVGWARTRALDSGGVPDRVSGFSAQPRLPFGSGTLFLLLASTPLPSTAALSGGCGDGEGRGEVSPGFFCLSQPRLCRLSAGVAR